MPIITYHFLCYNPIVLSTLLISYSLENSFHIVILKTLTIAHNCSILFIWNVYKINFWSINPWDVKIIQILHSKQCSYRSPVLFKYAGLEILCCYLLKWSWEVAMVASLKAVLPGDTGCRSARGEHRGGERDWTCLTLGRVGSDSTSWISSLPLPLIHLTPPFSGHSLESLCTSAPSSCPIPLHTVSNNNLLLLTSGIDLKVDLGPPGDWWGLHLLPPIFL